MSGRKKFHRPEDTSSPPRVETNSDNSGNADDDARTFASGRRPRKAAPKREKKAAGGDPHNTSGSSADTVVHQLPAGSGVTIELRRNKDGTVTVMGDAAAVKALRRVGQDDPAVLVHWDLERFAAAVAAMNAHFAGLTAVQQQQFVFPHWMPGGTVFPLSTLTVRQGLVDFLSQFAGGMVCMSLLAPNTLPQYGRILSALGQLNTDPFVQHMCTSALTAPIAEIFVLGDSKRQTTGESAKPAAPGNQHPAFV